MTIIDQEKLNLFREHSGHILNKPFEGRTAEENAWLQWASKRITQLEEEK